MSGTIRQGFKQSTSSVSPFIESTIWDSYLVNSVYDSLYRPNPLNPGQLVQWMIVDSQQLSTSQLTYRPPSGTVQTLRFTLRSDLFFQDASPVTAYDVAFSYLNMVNTFEGAGAASVAGVTILGLHQFDINLNMIGPFTLSNLLTIPIMPGQFWTNSGSAAWKSAINTCGSTASCFPARYTQAFPNGISCNLNCTGFPASIMTVNVAFTTPTFDPIANHIFIGSGPWQCGTGTGLGGSSCSSSGAQNPPVGGSYILTRFGAGLTPASSIGGIYFRSSGNLALCIWATLGCSLSSQQSSFLIFSQIAACYGQPVNLSGLCGHWQHGIGNPGNGNIVGLNQISVVLRFAGINWLQPYDWQTSPPTGIAPFPPTLHEGTITISPASVVGCPGGYDC
jgi:hypothetical protein